LAACRALTHLRDGARPSQLPNAARLLLELDWAAFARGTETPQPIRADILAAVAQILQGHQRFQESADFVRALPPEFAADLRFQHYLGVALVVLHQWPAAQEVLSGAVRALSPSTPPDLAEGIRFASAELHECLGRASEALPLLNPDAATDSTTQ